MKLGIILETKKPEHVWNAFRLSIKALGRDHNVKIFLLNEGSELEDISDTDRYDISCKVSEFLSLGGKILACGTCLESRGKSGTDICPVSTTDDLLDMIEMSDKTIVYS